MRIGIDARPLAKERAGIGTYVYNIVKQLNSIDSENEYFLFSCREVVLDFELGDNWHIVKEDFPVGTLWLFVRGSSLIKRYGIDVFWGTQHVLPYGKVKGVRYVLTICDLAQFRIKGIGDKYNSVVQKVFVKGSCKRADRILAISEATKCDVIDIFGIESSRIVCTYLGGTDKAEPCSESEVEEVKSKFKINGRYFLFVSTLEPRKNIETIVDGFDVLMASSNCKMYLVLAGGLGWKYESILSRIERSPWKDYIIRTGFVSQREKQCLFSGAEAFVYPSLYEGFGIPILEAMNYGIPIITSAVSSLPEVGQGAVMYLSDYKSAQSMADLMSKCIHLTEDERRQIAEKDELQRNRFSWKKCAMETRDELLKV